MIQDRRVVLGVLMADVFLLFFTVSFLVNRYNILTTSIPGPMAPVAKEAPPPTIPAAKPLTSEPAASKPSPSPVQESREELSPVIPVPAAASSDDVTLRKIQFSYRSSKPTQVEIIGSFNNWTPEALAKGANHTWAITLSLAPGDYTYNYLVDGKVIRDPNNPRTAPEGRSFLTVKPAPE